MSGRTYPPGVPCWIDTTQPEIDAAATFYAGLFGWTFREAAPGGGTDRYLVAQLDGADVAGIAGGREDPTAWSTYIAVGDADAAVERLVAAGAVLRAPATDAGEDGRSAALADPEGVEFRLWQPKRQGGAQSVNQPGTWNFSDLHTCNPEAAIGFYQGAFGWQVDKVGFGADTALARHVRCGRPGPDGPRRRTARHPGSPAGRYGVDARGPDPRPAGGCLHRQPVHATNRLTGPAGKPTGPALPPQRPPRRP